MREKSADAENIIKLILLSVSQGTEIGISAEDDDESETPADLGQLVKSNFEEVNAQVTI